MPEKSTLIYQCDHSSYGWWHICHDLGLVDYDWEGDNLFANGNGRNDHMKIQDLRMKLAEE